MDWWTYERQCISDSCSVICGIDEAGRGPLAGPVYAAAVILPFGIDIEGINDSKKLTPKKRDILYDEITHKALDYSVAFSTVEEIDSINILNATFLAMKRAVEGLKVKPQTALIDGNMIRGMDIPCRCIIKGDSLSASIAAASILAKVSRDRYMIEISREYPLYELAEHKGYPTPRHFELLRQYGSTPIHRKSFLKSLNSTEER